MGDTPDREYLMNLQGLFSGKTVGDLDSVPGYYGGTASYKFVQNARSLKQHRSVRRKMAKTDAEQASVNLQSHLTPSDTRVAAFNAARSSSLKKKAVKGEARGSKFKFQGELGATNRSSKKAGEPGIEIRQGGFRTDENGNRIFDPEVVVEREARTRPNPQRIGVPVGATA
jgi:hypothetical protein